MIMKVRHIILLSILLVSMESGMLLRMEIGRLEEEIRQQQVDANYRDLLKTGLCWKLPAPPAFPVDCMKITTCSNDFNR